MPRMYRIVVTIETYNSLSELKDEEAIPVQELTNRAISNDRQKAVNAMTDALEQFGDDPLYGEKMWEN